MIEARCPHPNVVLHHFHCTEFAAFVKEHSPEVRTNKFPCWTQFVAMLFCHLWPRLTPQGKTARVFPAAWASCPTLG
ncbi:hypothetical protein DFAR_3720002 [Desulfarculales bacterium]